MKEALRVINEMRDAGIIGNYAIGGAIGAIFYLEPIETHDLDVFNFVAKFSMAGRSLA